MLPGCASIWLLLSAGRARGSGDGGKALPHEEPKPWDRAPFSSPGCSVQLSPSSSMLSAAGCSPAAPQGSPRLSAECLPCRGLVSHPSQDGCGGNTALNYVALILLVAGGVWEQRRCPWGPDPGSKSMQETGAAPRNAQENPCRVCWEICWGCCVFLSDTAASQSKEQDPNLRHPHQTPPPPPPQPRCPGSDLAQLTH